MIIFYEDEPFYLKEKFEYLKTKGFEILVYDRADELLETYKGQFQNIECIVIDIMVFGPGNDFPKYSEDGLISGYILVDELEKIEDSFQPSKRIPKIVYTNRQSTDFLSKLEKDSRIDLVLEKNNVPYDEFVEKIIQEINKK